MIHLEHLARAHMEALQREASSRARPSAEAVVLPVLRTTLRIVPTPSAQAACVCEARTA